MGRVMDDHHVLAMILASPLLTSFLTALVNRGVDRHQLHQRVTRLEAAHKSPDAHHAHITESHAPHSR